MDGKYGRSGGVGGGGVGCVDYRIPGGEHRPFFNIDIFCAWIQFRETFPVYSARNRHHFLENLM